MPAYPANPALLAPTALYVGDSSAVFNNELIVLNEVSDRVAIAVAPSEGGNGSAVSVEIQFAGAPGAFEIDVQEADTDTNNAYIALVAAGVIDQTKLNANNWARVDVINLVGNFIRLFVKTQPANAVACTARIFR